MVKKFSFLFYYKFYDFKYLVKRKVKTIAFSVAFAVDPLYHQTSAQFDEGGAKGLLMNNLGVYSGCKVLFDSLEVPGKCISCDNQQDKTNTIDLSFAKGMLQFLDTSYSWKLLSIWCL